MASQATRDDLRTCLETFLGRYANDARHITELRRFLVAEPTLVTPADIMPVDQYLQRVEAVEQIVAEQRRVLMDNSFTLNPVEYSLLARMPLEALGSLRRYPSGTQNAIASIEDLVRLFFQQNVRLESQQSAGPSPPQSARRKRRRTARTPSVAMPETKIPRASSAAGNRARPMEDSAQGSRLPQLSFSGNDRQGTGTSSATTQVDKGKGPATDVEIASTIDPIVAEKEKPLYRSVKIHDAPSNRPIVSGSIFKVQRPTKYVHLFKAMMDMQWAIITSATMAGGAEAIPLHFDSDDDDPFWNIVEWSAGIDDISTQSS